MIHSTFYVTLSSWLSLSLQFSSLWVQRRLPSPAGSAWQNDEYECLDTSALFSRFLLVPALKFSIKRCGWHFPFDCELNILVQFMHFSRSKATLSQQFPSYLSVPSVRYLFWLWYFLFKTNKQTKIHPKIPTPTNQLSGKKSLSSLATLLFC